MNTLKLKVTSYHRLTPGQVVEQSFNEHGGSIGRSAKSDWVLPDPDKVISSVHAYISYQAGSFYITDNSTNGLFVNRSVQPLGKGNSQALSDGDYLQLGDYEIEVAVEAQQAATTNHNSVQQPVAQQPVAQNTVDSAPSMETHTEALSQDPYAENFTPPMAQIPEDWDENGGEAPAGQARPAAEPSVPPQPRAEEVKPQPTPADRSVPPQQSVPPQPLQQPQQPPVEAQPVQQPPAQPTTPSPQPVPAPPPQPTAPKTPPPAAAPGVAQNSSFDSISQEQAKTYLTAFLNAAGLREEDLPRDVSPALFEAMGGALRFSLQGMLDILRARSDMKSEFRVMQTTIRTQENNPLKFSINVDEAMRNLFLRQVPGFLPWFQAIESCFKDMSSHELALMAGTQGALQGVLDTLDPEEIARANQNESALHKVLPAAKKAKLWDIFVTLHQEAQSEVGQGSEKTFSEDFAAAYEAQLRKLGAS
ncbi:type VI secretion system-associated FHA domain protein TagH [Kangiella shandongensis]|uniref:type VI secretion system-associated FHA domain protein TagH n=1 Tax=Kangiella shandongensis TaxID=2763258 RepID=UPI001CC0E183|nr:type VI secretion system-associated FHA domain protein TagH [Kangiella shandongensis]